MEGAIQVLASDSGKCLEVAEEVCISFHPTVFSCLPSKSSYPSVIDIFIEY